jgi:hypothetical protein
MAINVDQGNVMGKLSRLLRLRAPRAGHPPREDSSHSPHASHPAPVSGRWWKGKRHAAHTAAAKHARRPSKPAPAGESDETSEVSIPSMDSGVYLKVFLPAVATQAALYALSAPEREELQEHVTLVVYGWNNVQPGTLSWVFPSLHAALGAARAMRNAVRWIVVRGERAVDEDARVDEVRATSAVLAEATG